MELNQDQLDFIALSGKEFRIVFNGNRAPDYNENDPWPKLVKRINLIDCDPDQIEHRTIFSEERTMQGCSQMHVAVRKRLWIQLIKHIIKALGIKQSDLFEEQSGENKC